MQTQAMIDQIDPKWLGDWELFELKQERIAPMKGWRTYLLALGVTVVGQLQTWDWATLITPTNAGWVLTGLGVVMAVLRTVTNTPPGTK